MSQARFEHTATLVDGNEVLVTGGSDGSKFLASAEIYNSADGAWRTVGAMGTARGGHTATRLDVGRVLIVGAGTVAGVGAELYDPDTATFTEQGALVTERSHHTATRLADDTVIVIGGFIGEGVVTDRIERFDPASGNFRDAGRLVEPRAYHVATLLSNGQILVATGESPINLASAEIYDPATETSRPIAALAEPHAYCGAVVELPGDRVMILGGEGIDPPNPSRDNGAPHVASAELLDSVLETWSVIAEMSTARCGHSATRLADGLVLVVGGHVGAGGRQPLPTTEIYDPRTGRWTDADAMQTCRHAHRDVLVDDHVIVIGGVVDGEVSSTLAAFATR
jgi:N-acetylneuraminic acid mutarotase